jgi:hypothetical protein
MRDEGGSDAPYQRIQSRKLGGWLPIFNYPVLTANKRRPEMIFIEQIHAPSLCRNLPPPASVSGNELVGFRHISC